MKAKDNNEIDKQCLKKMVVKFRHKVVNVISISHECLNSFVRSIRSIYVALISGNNFCVSCAVGTKTVCQGSFVVISAKGTP